MNSSFQTVGVVCGGRSLEHSFSIISANNIANTIKDRYNVVILCIDYEGKWHLGTCENMKNLDSLVDAAFDFDNTPVVEVLKNGRLLASDGVLSQVDIVFPITNGIDGHQGAIPGMMRLLDIPCVGSDVFETVVCIDKEITKSLLQNYDLPIVPYLVGRELEDHTYEEVVKTIGTPFFVKPCRLSSSAGISKVSNANEYEQAIKEALKFDDKFLLEQGIDGRELECSVIGNEEPIASDILGEVISDDFYCYTSKYKSKTAARTQVPAKLDKSIEKMIQKYSKSAYKVLGCKGFARIDFFLDKEDKVYINEATTLPLFTAISMFPKLWQDDLNNVVGSLVEMGFNK